MEKRICSVCWNATEYFVKASTWEFWDWVKILDWHTWVVGNVEIIEGVMMTSGHIHLWFNECTAELLMFHG